MKYFRKILSFIAGLLDDIVLAVDKAKWFIVSIFILGLMVVGVTKIPKHESHHSSYDVMLLNADGNIVRSVMGVEADEYEISKDAVTLQNYNGDLVLYISKAKYDVLIQKRK